MQAFTTSENASKGQQKCDAKEVTWAERWWGSSSMIRSFDFHYMWDLGCHFEGGCFFLGCKTGKKWVQNACEANLTVKTQCFCGSVRDGELCQIDSHRAWMDGWIFCVCNMFAFPLLLLTGDRGGSDDYYCIPGSLLAQRFGTSPPQDFPPLYFAAPTWECAYPGYTYQQDQHTIPGKTSRKEVQVLSMDVGSIVKWEVSYITVGYLFN